jgi:teichuronic acid exporter
LSDLKHKTLTGLFWSFSDSFGMYFIKFGFSIAIARILSPQDYGLVGMIAIFIAVSTMISESGFGMALIQKKDADEVDYSTVFFFNLFSSVVLYLLIFFFAGLIADFYRQPLLKNITRVLSLGIVLSSLLTIQLSILSKQLNFKKQTKINLVSSLTSGSVGLLLAYKGFAVWALVIMSLSGSFISVLLYWVFTNWYPRFVFSFKSFKSLYIYGYKIFLSGLSDTIFQNIYYPIIGKGYSVGELGFYTRSKSFYDIFINRLPIAFGRVTFSALSTINDQKERLRSAYIRILKLLVFFIFPIVTILLVTAEPFVKVLLTAKWLPAVPFMKLLYIEGFFYPIYFHHLSLFSATGRSDTVLKVEILKKTLLIITIIIAFNFGIGALIIGQLIASFIVFFVAGFYVGKKQEYNLYNQLKVIIPTFLISVIVYFFGVYIIPKTPINMLVKMIIQIIGCSLLYYYIMKMLKINTYVEFKSVFINYIPIRLRFIF